MKLKPLFNRVVVRPLEATKKTPSGLILPDCAQTNIVEARVLWAADGLNISANDRILYIKSAGLEYECAGLSVVILKSTDVLALVYNE
ncbi:10 kDa chaperonin [Candidatus Hodgkinia cicadicola]|nr:10 kDa chaperonin [Candidatus Hodgkinia cicadicola]